MTVPPALSAALADRYRLERELGQGGMATVYLAEDLKHGRQVAIKVLKPELAAVIGPERFVREIRTIAALQHPHILGLIDSGEVNGTAYFVMPFVEGESLRDRLTRDKQLPVADAVRIATEVASALDYAHRHGVIHRDIKPENILLHDGQALVADFGIALAASNSGGSRMTETGMSLGTPTYMSPEQAMGEREVTARSDVYALGVVTYEMLTGDPPFTGSTAQAIVARMMTEAPRSLVTQRHTIPEPIEAAVLTALEKLPADRFASAAEFAQALTSPSAAATRRVMPAQRRRIPRGPLVGAALALAAIGAARWLPARRSAVAPGTAVTFAITSGDDVRPFNTFISWSAAVSPDGRFLVYAGTGGPGNYQYYVRRLDQLQARPLPGTVNANQALFSPDSKWLSFESVSTGKLSKIPLEGGEPVPLVAATSNNGGTWSSRGEIILGWEGKIRGLSRVADGGGALTQFTWPDSARGESHVWPLALADGRTIVFTSESGNQRSRAQLEVVSLDDGVVHPLGIVGLRALGVVANRLIYLQANGTVMAVPFELRGHRVSGTPVAVLDSIPVCRTCNGDAPVYLSTGGALTYIRGTVPSRLMWVDSAGAARPAVTDARVFANPRISPDGRRIAVTVSSELDDVWIYDLATGTPTRLTSGGNNSNPEWSTDGSLVYFVSDRSGQAALWHQAADRHSEAEMVPGTGGSFGGVLSPDGRTLLSTVPENGTTLYTRPVGGDTVPRRVGTGDSPRFSPDGRAVAYTSNESGANEVLVRPASGSGTSIQLSAGGGAEPVWSPDGRRVYYVNHGRLMVAILVSGPTLGLASRDSLFIGRGFGGIGGASYDVSRDGKRFLTVEAEDRSVRLVVVLNWGVEVAARLDRP